MEFDETVYVEAPQGQGNLMFSDENSRQGLS